jgi:NAD-dependent dihydropyrimidine dehydrogenase PreA subunit
VIREIVTIDEKLCDGCGVCVPACQEGALRIVDGKARLVADRLCDGLGACLGHCPRGAIKIERRDADGFDETAVAAHADPSIADHGHAEPAACPAACWETFQQRNGAGHQHTDGCPGARFAQFAREPGVSGTASVAGQSAPSGQPSELTHWPVQLRLLPANAPVLRDAKLLVAADCVSVACADFHSQLLRDHAVVIACPKLDDTSGYVEKLEAMIRHNHPREITVAHMEVPCCQAILQAVLEARQRADSDTPIEDVVISTRGQVIARRRFGGRLLSETIQVHPD